MTDEDLRYEYADNTTAGSANCCSGKAKTTAAANNNTADVACTKQSTPVERPFTTSHDNSQIDYLKRGSTPLCHSKAGKVPVFHDPKPRCGSRMALFESLLETTKVPSRRLNDTATMGASVFSDNNSTLKLSPTKPV